MIDIVQVNQNIQRCQDIKKIDYHNISIKVILLHQHNYNYVEVYNNSP